MSTAVASVHTAESYETPIVSTAATAAVSGGASVLQPAVIVIFGATGDLTARKLMPALFALDRGGYLPAETAIVGIGHRAKTDEQFEADVRQALAKFGCPRRPPPTARP